MLEPDIYKILQRMEERYILLVRMQIIPGILLNQPIIINIQLKVGICIQP